MERQKSARISQREYAHLLGISNEAVSKAIREGKIDKGWDKVEKKIIVDQANIEWGALHMKTNVFKLLQQQPGEESQQADYWESAIGKKNGLTLTNESSFAEAKRVREIIQAQLAALNLKERKEELVRKDEVYKQLYAFGQQIRIAIMATPDRGIDAILASKSRAEAHNIMSASLIEVLEGLTNVEFDFVPRQPT